MIRIAKEINCDNCSSWERLENESVNYCWPSMVKRGWTRGKGKHFCPDCSRKKKGIAQLILNAREEEIRNFPSKLTN